MFMGKYIMTFFTQVLPLSICCRIYDIFVFENEKIVFRAMLAMFKMLEDILPLQTNAGDILQAVAEPMRYCPTMKQDQFIDICHTFTFSQTLLGKLDYEFSSRYVDTV